MWFQNMGGWSIIIRHSLASDVTHVQHWMIKSVKGINWVSARRKIRYCYDIESFRLHAVAGALKPEFFQQRFLN